MPPQDDSGRERGPDLGTAAVTDLDERLEPLEAPDPSEMPLPEGLFAGFSGQTAALAAGGVVSLWALRALANRQLRAIPYGIVGVALLVRGLSGRAGEPEELSLDQQSTGGDERDSTGPDSGDESGHASETSGVDDEVSTDPRTTEDGVDVDRSADPTADEEDEPQSANEASEATGPKPQQAEPTQTDATEPEETPDEDASSATPTAGADGDGSAADTDEEGLVDTDDEE